MDQIKQQHGIKETKYAEGQQTLVRFSDNNMVLPTHKRSGYSGGFFSRRNKCLIATLVLTVAFLILFINAGLFGSVPVYTGELCKLEDIPLQKNLDKKKLSGNWYGAYTKGLTNPLLASVLEFSDVKINFILKDDGNYDVKSVGGKFLGLWCPPGEGHLESRDPDHLQRLVVFFDTPTGKKFGTKPVWILKTDYSSYAVLYSCWEETEDGLCKNSGAYAGVITRSREELPRSKMDDIKAAISGACINPEALRPIKHEGYCKDAQKEIS